MVAAPGRVSTITGWRQLSVIFCPIMRARLSADPPGANGTMILIGFSGYLSAGDCAAAPPGPRTAAAAATAAARTVRQAECDEMSAHVSLPRKCLLDVASSSCVLSLRL